MGEAEVYSLRVVTSLAEIEAGAWNACANPAATPFNPFVAHEFLLALEVSGSATAATGWAGRHILAFDGAGRLAGAMPLYLKTHSRGEYVFDHAFAQAYHQAGGRYYPKLQCAAPFTPATGPRLLVGSGAERAAVEALLLEEARRIAGREDASSLHVTFPSQAEWERGPRHGMLQRTDQQFQWLNAGYASYDDFLDALASRKRKAIRKERREALAGGLTVERLTGADIREAHWDAFYEFYLDTGSRKWGRPYLNRAFFSLAGAAMSDRMLLVMARNGPRYIAGALNFIGGDALYGRYWGCVEERPYLHFELCYHQAIDYAVAHDLARVEAGAQGDHKLARGYLPRTTYSLHQFFDPGLHRAVARYLAQERLAVAAEGEALSLLAPFKRAPDGDEEGI